mgnify:CR=1 FL=1
MTDKKISALTSATLPLNGTEVLPIVQSSTTENITVNNLASGNLKSQSTTGVLQVSGPSTASTRVMTVPDANFTAARTDSSQTFSGLQTFSNGTSSIGTSGGAAQYYTACGNAANYGGNWYDGSTVYNTFIGRIPSGLSGVGEEDAFGYVTIENGTPTLRVKFTKSATTFNNVNVAFATAAKGINFSANTPAAGMTSQLLNWYEEGTFTPTVVGYTSAGTATYIRQLGYYTRVGRQVFFNLDVVYNSGTGTGDLGIAGLPFACNSASMLKSFSVAADGLALTAGSYLNGALLGPSATTFYLYQSATGSATLSSVPYDAAAQIVVSGSYFV